MKNFGKLVGSGNIVLKPVNKTNPTHLYQGVLLDEIGAESGNRFLMGTIRDFATLMGDELVGNSQHVQDFVDFDFYMAHNSVAETLEDLELLQEGIFGCKKCADYFGHEEQQTLLFSYYGNTRVFASSFYDDMDEEDVGYELEKALLTVFHAHYEGTKTTEDTVIFVKFTN